MSHNSTGILRDYKPDSDESPKKIESDLHGDMQRVAEMSTLLRCKFRTER